MNNFRAGLTVDKLAAATDLLTNAQKHTWAGELEEALDVLLQASVDVELALRATVREMREHEWTWQQIADQLGVSRQAVQQRFGAGPPGSRS